MTDDNAVGDLQHDYFASIWEYSILPCYRICGISDNNDKLTIFSITNYVVCNKLINLKCARNCHSNQNVTGILSHTIADTVSVLFNTRKPSYRWLTRATRKPAKNYSNSTCLQRCRWQYWPIFIRLAVVASEICEIPRNSLKIQTFGVQGHPRSSILVSIESPCTTS